MGIGQPLPLLIYLSNLTNIIIYAASKSQAPNVSTTNDAARTDAYRTLIMDHSAEGD